MNCENYQIGDLLMHPKKAYGSLYAIVVETKRYEPGENGNHPWNGFGIRWVDKPKLVCWFSVNEWCETEKGFRLMAKGKQNV